MTDFTEDWLLNENVRIFQPVKGYRAGLDAILLAAALPHKNIARALDVGCGAGGALLPAAWRLNTVEFTGIERESRMADLARCGAEANQVTHRVNIQTTDIQGLGQDWENKFDLVFSNPPYFEPGKIQATTVERTHAYMADTPLKDWLKFMLFTARPKGRITLIHRAGVLSDILSYLHSRSGQIEVLPVFAAPEEPAKRVIVTARKGLRKGDVTMHRGLCLHPQKGNASYTNEADAILKGAAFKPLSGR